VRASPKYARNGRVAKYIALVVTGHLLESLGFSIKYSSVEYSLVARMLVLGRRLLYFYLFSYFTYYNYNHIYYRTETLFT
jgi:hypothetical protein